MFEKKELRKAFKTLRESLKSAEKDEKIAENALATFGEYASYFVYLSYQTEVDTHPLIKRLKAKNKRICVPKIVERDMLAVPLTGELKPDKYGILAPTEGAEETCEVVFTPLLAADKLGYRLGYGGGYYDRYFAKHAKVLRVGLAYAGQVMEELPHEETDIPLHALVTEEGVRYFERDKA